MSEPTNSASGVDPAADTLFADLENTQPPYDPEYDAHIPPEDSSAPEEDPFAHESFMPELNPEAVNAQTVTAHEDALGEFMPPAYRVGGYGSEYNPEDPYGERTYSLSTIDPATLIDGLNDRQREAVLHAGSPLLIVAGAGSGKTRGCRTASPICSQPGGQPPDRFSPSPSRTRPRRKCVSASKR